jgi:hypothetical protein
VTARRGPVVEWARSLGCQVERGRGGHWRVTYRGRFVAAVSCSPSDPRTELNERSRIRRGINKIKDGVGT